MMSIRGYKIAMGLLTCVSVLLAWYCFDLFNSNVWFAFIESQCEITQDMYTDSVARDVPGDVPAETKLEFLVSRLEFLIGYHDGHIGSVDGQLTHTLDRDYQRTLGNAVAVLRKKAQTDLGDDPQVWIKVYDAKMAKDYDAWVKSREPAPSTQ